MYTFILNSSGTILFGILYLLRALILLHAIYCVVKWMYFSLVKNEDPGRRPGLKLSIFTLTAFLLFAEAVFMFIPQSQGNTQFGLGDVAWSIFYMRYKNEKKYRDENISGRINNGKKKVFFLGDSFTYGNGIKDPNDRFSNIVAKDIATKGYEVFNLGKGNSDTREEFVRLMQFGYSPDVLVLQYYFNDIDPTARRFEKNEKPVTGLTGLVFKAGVLVSQTSFFINFVAVNLAKFTTPFQSGDFKKKMAAAYHNEDVMREHLADLQSIINYCTLNKTKLYVLLIPDMREPFFTERECYPPLINFLDEKKIPYIGIYNEIKDKTTPQRVVSPVDAHANEDVQKVIAQKLLQNIPEFNR